MYSDNNTYELILNRALSNSLLDTVDKRTGSIIYDALAPVCLELAEAYVKMDILETQTFLMSATGTNLDKKAYDYGLSRIEATNAERIATFKAYKKDENGDYVFDDNGKKILVDLDVTVGSRFTTISDNDSLTFEYTGQKDGYNILTCEQTGTVANEYIGIVLPITPVADLVEAKIISTYTPAEDEETDDTLRERIKALLTDNAFGGNIADYIKYVNAIEGVGNTKVFPAWQYNGSVLLSVVDTNFNPISTAFANTIKEKIDPTENSGEGVGVAPIGHYVTVTTPIKKNIKIKVSLKLENDVEIGNVQEEIESLIQAYFSTVRKSFGQNKSLAIYKSRITEAVLKCDKVLTVDSVLLCDTSNNNKTYSDNDIIYVDAADLNKQYLPYVMEVTLIV